MNLLSRYWRAAVVVLLPIGVYLLPRERVFSGETLCLFHNLVGQECWGCGMTRAVVALMYLDFTTAWAYNRAVVIVAPLLVYIWVKWIVRLAKSPR